MKVGVTAGRETFPWPEAASAAAAAAAQSQLDLCEKESEQLGTPSRTHMVYTNVQLPARQIIRVVIFGSTEAWSGVHFPMRQLNRTGGFLQGYEKDGATGRQGPSLLGRE